MVSVRRGLLQGGVRDVCLLVGVHGRLEKVGHEEDLQETERKGGAENGTQKKTKSNQICRETSIARVHGNEILLCSYHVVTVMVRGTGTKMV